MCGNASRVAETIIFSNPIAMIDVAFICAENPGSEGFQLKSTSSSNSNLIRRTSNVTSYPLG